MNSTYKIGVAQTDITPPVGIKLAGFASRNDPSTAVYHPLRAVAIAIDDDSTPLLMVSAEWIGFYDQTDRVRGAISVKLQIPESQIVLSGTHTHCGPCVRKIDLERHGEVNYDYISEAIDKIIQCAKEAWQSRSEATLRTGAGQCSLSRCRRLPDPENPPKVQRSMAPYEDGFADHEVPIITVHAPDGSLQAVLYSYACHPTTRGGLLIGGDYVCYATDRIEEKFPGVTTAFLQGCGGDQKIRPVDPNDKTFGAREIDQVQDAGRELGDAVSAVLKADELTPVQGPVTVTQQFLDLHTEPLDEEIVKRDLESAFSYKQQWASRQLKQPADTTIVFELQTIRFGSDLVIITMAAEMTVEYSLRLKRELGQHFKHVLPLGYTNAIIGYVPVKRQIPEEGYEVWDSNQYHHRTGPYVAETEDQIHVAAHASLSI